MEELQLISLDKFSFQLKEKHNFQWITALGEVFSVFDQQDSGNICFGVEKDGVKKFVKYAVRRPKNIRDNPKTQS